MKGRVKAPESLTYAKSVSWLSLLLAACCCRAHEACADSAAHYRGPLQVTDESTVPQQSVEDNTNQQEDSPSATAEMPASRDDGWDEQPGWDFQDVPLDSPRLTGRQTSASKKGSPDRRAVYAARQGQIAQGKDDSHGMQLASLQKANDALTARLKHVETVRKPRGVICKPTVVVCLKIVLVL